MLDRSASTVATAAGLTDLVLNSSATLLDKAERFQRIAEERHDRHGMISGCGMPSFGDISSCQTRDGDNNGLWTLFNDGWPCT